MENENTSNIIPELATYSRAVIAKTVEQMKKGVPYITIGEYILEREKVSDSPNGNIVYQAEVKHEDPNGTLGVVTAKETDFDNIVEICNAFSFCYFGDYEVRFQLKRYSKRTVVVFSIGLEKPEDKNKKLPGLN